MNLLSVIKKIRRLYYFHFHPKKYINLVGIQHGENFNVYGKVYWGSEPWIISFGNNIHITDGVRFITHDGGTLLFRHIVPDLEITKPIIVGSNVYIGTQTIILPGVTIGDNVIIGAGSVVTHDVPSDSVYAGVPARFIKPINAYMKKIEDESLHLGHLKGESKDIELRKHYGYKGQSRGIYS